MERIVVIWNNYPTLREYLKLWNYGRKKHHLILKWMYHHVVINVMGDVSLRKISKESIHPSDRDPSHLLLKFLHRLVGKLSSCLRLLQLGRQILDVLLVRLLPLVCLLLCHLQSFVFHRKEKIVMNNGLSDTVAKDL